MGVPDVDENVEAGWWRKTVDGGEFDDVEPVRFPDLNDDVDAVGVATHQLEMPALLLTPLRRQLNSTLLSQHKTQLLLKSAYTHSHTHRTLIPIHILLST